MITSRTYNMAAGSNFIEASELALTTIYEVKREGLQHDLFFTGSITGRTYAYTSSLGRISFPNAAAFLGEKVWVLYKSNTSTGPITPACVAVGITSTDLPNTTLGTPYAVFVPLTGSAPFTLSNVVKPAWLNIVIFGPVVQLTGFSNVLGIANVSFDVVNCGGASASFSDSFQVLQPNPNFTIQNQVPGALIQSLTNLNFVAQSGLIYPPPFQTLTGVHGAYAGIPTMSVTVGPFPFTLRFFINSIPIQNIPVSVNGIYPFTLVTSYALSDDLLIQLTP